MINDEAFSHMKRKRIINCPAARYRYDALVRRSTRRDRRLHAGYNRPRAVAQPAPVRNRENVISSPPDWYSEDAMKAAGGARAKFGA